MLCLSQTPLGLRATLSVESIAPLYPGFRQETWCDQHQPQCPISIPSLHQAPPHPYFTFSPTTIWLWRLPPNIYLVGRWDVNVFSGSLFTFLGPFPLPLLLSTSWRGLDRGGNWATGVMSVAGWWWLEILMLIEHRTSAAIVACNNNNTYLPNLASTQGFRELSREVKEVYTMYYLQTFLIYRIYVQVNLYPVSKRPRPGNSILSNMLLFPHFPFPPPSCNQQDNKNLKIQRPTSRVFFNWAHGRRLLVMLA